MGKKKGRVSSSRAAMNNRANQMNPNNKSYRGSSGNVAKSRNFMNDNRANQLNPKHPSYSSSRAGANNHRIVNNGKLQNHIQRNIKPSRPKSLKDILPRVQTNLRNVTGSSTQFELAGSAKYKTQKHGSDRDYRLHTKQPITRAQRKQIVKSIQTDPALKQRYSVRAKTNSIALEGVGRNPDIDIVPMAVAYQSKKPGFRQTKTSRPNKSFHGRPYLQNAVIAAKSAFPNKKIIKGCEISHAIERIAKKKPGLKADKSGGALLNAFVKDGGKSVRFFPEPDGRATSKKRAALSNELRRYARENHI